MKDLNSNSVFTGDCLHVLKTLEDNSIDAVISDPPYCSGGFSEASKKAAIGQGLRSETIREVGWFVNDNMSTSGLIWLLRSVMVECERVMKDGTSALIFTDWRMVAHLAPALESSGLQFRNMIVWDKNNCGLGNGFRPQHEIILHYVKGKADYYDQSTGNVIRCKRVNSSDKMHQTQKPVELLAKLLKVVSKEGDTVLDPFFGSGSLGEACVKLNRRFIGIEKDKTISRTAIDRIARIELETARSLFPTMP